MEQTQTAYSIELDNNVEDEWDYNNALEDMTEVLVSGADHYYIEGRGMGWQGLSGFIVVAANDAPRALMVNGDFRIVLWGDSDEPSKFRAFRYSHDEPTGASFTLRPATEQEVEDYL